MWPIILILVGGVLAAATISGGVVLYIHNLQRQITNLTESNKILEGHLRNVTKAGYVLAKFLPYKERFELAVEESERDWDTAQRAALVDLSIPGARDHRTEYAWKKEIDRSNFVGGRLLSAVHQAFGTAYTRLNVSMLRSAGRSKPIGKRP